MGASEIYPFRVCTLLFFHVLRTWGSGFPHRKPPCLLPGTTWAFPSSTPARCGLLCVQLRQEECQRHSCLQGQQGSWDIQAAVSKSYMEESSQCGAELGMGGKRAGLWTEPASLVLPCPCTEVWSTQELQIQICSFRSLWRAISKIFF